MKEIRNVIEIRDTGELHDSGYRMMEITLNGKKLSTCSDVLHISPTDKEIAGLPLFAYLSLDITENGTIRIFSPINDMAPDRLFNDCSSCVVHLTPNEYFPKIK